MNPPGLYYFPALNSEFIFQLEKEIESQSWTPIVSRGREVQHYGYYYNYRTRNIYEPAPPFSEKITELRNILIYICQRLGLGEINFNQCIINKYLPGQGISEHTDFHQYGPVIGCFTLGSEGTLIFKSGEEKYILKPESGSLYIMSGESRTRWTHQMKPLQSGQRISITFRSIKN